MAQYENTAKQICNLSLAFPSLNFRRNRHAVCHSIFMFVSLVAIIVFFIILKIELWTEDGRIYSRDSLLCQIASAHLREYAPQGIIQCAASILC